jgi:hypothetical protein
MLVPVAVTTSGTQSEVEFLIMEWPDLRRFIVYDSNVWTNYTRVGMLTM